MNWLRPSFRPAVTTTGRLAATIILVSVTPFLALAERDAASAAQRLFAQHCLECHGPDKQEGELRLDMASSVARVVKEGVLLERVATSDPSERMPPEGAPLSAGELRVVRDWLDSGATIKRHWAYEPLETVTPPWTGVAANDWSHPIDGFIRARLVREALAPSEEADRATLIKRLYYDLLGLPPTQEAVAAFCRDRSPNAYERLVDRLLSSVHFGERWGRHWLDKARYADSDGYEKDRPRPTAWYYRDWVIDAINADMPMDQFTMEQLAGDLLPEATQSQQLATAFHRQTLTNTEGGTDQEQFRIEAVFDRVETTGAIWLGLTFNCARCHHHKYDAISQKEYYQLFAFFNDGDETTLKLPKATAAEDVDEVAILKHRSRRTQVLDRGDFLRPGASVVAAGLQALPEISGRGDSQEPLDRLDLAQWLMDDANPLTPRVLVNQVWERLFGQGLVRTLNDFGVRGDPPTHPLLLDWLGQEYQRLNWSRKRLIRTVVASATYRQSSRHRRDLESRDPTNRWLARQNRFRVEAEIVRDLSLAVSGLLSRRVGGPSVFPPMPPEIAALSYANSFKWTNSGGGDRYRRGLYTFFKRTAPHPNLVAFDCPDSNTTSLRRRRSNTPIQALTTLNNEVFVEAARALGKQALQENPEGTDEARLRSLLQRCLTRSPEPQELKRFAELLRACRAHYRSETGRVDAEKLAGEVSEWPQVSETAAWVAVARIALNLDEFITRE